MKVAILGTRGFPNIQGGVERHCEGLAVSLVKLGCNVIVFTRKPYVEENIKEFKGVKLIALPAFRHKLLEAFLHTFIGIFVALRYKPDILHIQAIGPALFTPLARILGMKVVVTSHGSNYKHLKWGFFAKLVFRLGELLGVIFANDVVAISKNIAVEIKRKYNKHVHAIPSGIKILQALKSEESLKTYRLTKSKYILTVGRFVPEKGFSNLIDAFNIAELSGWKLVIVGRADHESRYSRNLKEKAKKNCNIVLTGFLSGRPLQELYSHAGLFVLPSYYEGLPIVLLEAMSYGLLCLVSNIPANHCIALPDENYFTAGDIEQLSEKLQEFIKKPFSPYQKSSQIQMLRQKYNWDEIAKETLEVYKKVLNSKRCHFDQRT